jgi:hypothetical protein
METLAHPRPPRDLDAADKWRPGGRTPLLRRRFGPAVPCPTCQGLRQWIVDSRSLGGGYWGQLSDRQRHRCDRPYQ